MAGPLRFTRSLAPKLFVGGLLAAATSASLGAGSAPIPPCSPDGVCLPNYESWGWYQTRWRRFPGDAAAAPTEAAGGDQEESLGGPKLPGVSEEGQTGPKKDPKDKTAVPAPTLPDAAGSGPAVPADAPAADAAAGVDAGAGAEPAAEDAVPPVDLTPPGDAAPDALPDPTAPIDPFGAAPPTPPSWMIEPASFEPLPAAGGAAPASFNPASINHAPNMQGDDAPPALPADLQDLFGATVGRPAWMQSAAAPVVLAQPAKIRAASRPAIDRGVVQTSAETPPGIQLINPASAIAAPSDASGLQQAIYFEASDQSGAAVALPPVSPAN